MKKFTVKEQRFIDFYNGNATEAARKAGYKNPERSGKQNVRKRTILEAIKNREKKRNKSKIASREERQEFWTDMMDDSEKDSDKLKASELLGRSEADFTENIKHDASGNLMKTVVKALEERGKSSNQPG